jgi:hypothetical protein
MNEKNFISYKLFCQRKKFNLERYIMTNSGIDYNHIRNLFIERKVIPPPEELFLKIKNNVLLQEKAAGEVLSIVEDNVSVVSLPKKARKSTRKRKKKNE